MATDNTMGLFTDPNQLLQQQTAATDQRAAQFAQMTPMQQAQYGIYGGASRVGGGIAGMFGVEDPQMKLQSMRRSILQNVDQTDPQSIAQAAQALAQAGDQQGAMQLAQLARTANTELVKNRQAESVIKKNENFQASQADAEKKRNIISTVEDSLSRGEAVDPVEINKAKLAFGDISRPKTFQQADGTIVTVPPTVDASMFPNIGKYMSGAATGGGGSKVAGVIETPTSIAAKEAAIATANSAISGIDDSLNAIKGIRDLRTGSISTNPFLVEMMKKVPSAAMAQEDLIKTITAGKVIDTIAEMKAQSKTGATGFGALNGRELDQLESKARRLNPQSPTFEADLKYIEDSLTKNKGLIQSNLTKKQAALPNANNAAGTEGRIAILQQEYATAAKQGNQANMAGLTRELATLGAKPSTTGAQPSKLTAEQRIALTLKANRLEDNPVNRTRVIDALKAAEQF